MKRVVFSTLAVVVVLGFAFAMSASPAMADTLDLSITLGSTTYMCGSGLSCTFGANSVVYSGSLSDGAGTINFTVDSGIKGPGPYDLDLTYAVSTSGAITGPVVIAFSDDTLSGSNLSWNAQVGGTQGSGDTTQMTAVAVDVNTMTYQELCQTGIVSTSPVSAACLTSPAYSNTNFDLADEVSLSIANNQSVSGDAGLAQTPEPGTLVMFGSGLLGLAAIVRRKLKV